MDNILNIKKVILQKRNLLKLKVIKISYEERLEMINEIIDTLQRSIDQTKEIDKLMKLSGFGSSSFDTSKLEESLLNAQNHKKFLEKEKWKK